MVTMPLFGLLLFGAVVAVKWGPLKAGPVILGLLIGLTMAGTPMGPPTVNAIENVTHTVITGFSSAFGQGGDAA